MVDKDTEYENLLRLIFPPEKYSEIFYRLYNFEWKNTTHHEETFRQHCLKTAHLMDEFCREKGYLQQTWNGITYARLVGFLHDMGKPFVVKMLKSGKELFTGHAQVGARMFSLRFEQVIPEPFLETMSLLIDAHMCCLRSDLISMEKIFRVNAVMNLYFPNLDILPLLKCLHRADSLAKTPAVENELPSYDFSTIVPYRKDDRVVIYLVGISGCGKTTISKQLIDKLSCFGSVEHLERDRVLMDMALEGESYLDCYNRIQNNYDLKTHFQSLWKQTVESSTSQILLIDTVINYFHLDSELFRNCFRIGMYCVPINYFHPSKFGKSPRPIEFPTKSFRGYPNVLTECKDGTGSLEVATGVWQIIPSIVERFLNLQTNTPLQYQPSLATLWKKYQCWDAIRAMYPSKSLVVKPIHSFSDSDLWLVSYRPANDVVYGETRYYRGEIVMLDKTTNEMHLVRCSLPTFQRNLNGPKYGTESIHFVMTPKYDGCLWHVLYIPMNHALYKLMQQVPGVIQHEWGLFFLGSKQTLVMDKPIKDRLDKALDCAFETFIVGFKHYCQDRLATLHFEILIQSESEELTVYYDKNFVKFLGVTEFTDETREFSLPKPTDPFAVEQTKIDRLEACQTWFNNQHEKFLTGDEMCEPEGFVVYVYRKDVLVDIVKMKFMEYLAVQRPYKFENEYEKILTNPKLMQRFQKCRHVKDVRAKLNPLKIEIENFIEQSQLLKKSEFVTLLNENKEKINEWQTQLDDIMNVVRYPHISINKMFLQKFPNSTAIMLALFKKVDNLTKYL